MTAIEYFARTTTVRIITELRDGGEVTTPIWGVVVDGVPYIRSGYGEDSKWYRRVQRTGRADFTDGSHRYPATVKNVLDEQVLRQADDAYEAKYAGQGEALRQVIAPGVREYTMRVILPG